MASENKGATAMSEALASQSRSGDANATPAARAPKIPVALSSDDLHELTAALASYMERQNFAAARE